MRITALLAGCWAILALFVSTTARAEKPLLKEFFEPQDEFVFHPLSPEKALLECCFESQRHYVRQFTLTVPEDVSLSWRFLGGRGLVGTAESVIGASQAVDVPGWISIRRLWLSDIPMAALGFPKVLQTAARIPDSTQTATYVLKQATFELTFSRPFMDPGRASSIMSSFTPALKDAFGKIGRVLVANPWDIPAARGFPTLPPQMKPSLAAQNSRPLKITTKGLGVTRIEVRQLRESGFDPSQKRSLPFLTLTHLGRPYPLGVAASRTDRLSEGDWIWFFHRPIESSETEEDAYFLSWGDEPGKRINEKKDLKDLLPSDYAEKDAHREPQSWDYRTVLLERNLPENAVEQGDLAGSVKVFWHEFKSDGESLAFDFDLPGLIPYQAPAEIGEASLPIALKFFQPLNSQGECSLQVSVNGRKLESKPVPKGTSCLTFHAPMEGIRERANRVEVRVEGAVGPVSERRRGVFFDWMQIWHPGQPSVNQPLTSNAHLPHQKEDTLERKPTFVQWQIGDGNPNFRVLTLSDESETECGVYVPRIEAGHFVGPSSLCQSDWSIVDLDHAPPPERMRLVEIGQPLTDEETQADLLVVADERFAPVLEPYLERRRSQGWSCRLATTEQIYDEFSNGIKDLEVIKAFCRYALHFYQKPAPQYLWLVGEARWDPKNELGSHQEDLVPSPAVRTRLAVNSNDQWYGYLVGEDSFPDLLVSRVSVDTPDELENYLEKAKQEEDDSKPGWWKARSLLLVDGGFSKEMNACLENGLDRYVLPAIRCVDDYALDPFRKFEAVGKAGKEARGIRKDVVADWSEGARIVEYVGHGGITVWSPTAVFKGLNRPDSDVDRLANEGRYAFVTIRSCLSASVNWPTFPGEVSVAEALIKAPRRGAVAVLGSSGTEFSADQERFGANVRAAVWTHRFNKPSEIRAYAQCQFLLQDAESEDVADQFMLHGDPLLDLRFPESLELEDVKWESQDSGPFIGFGWKGGFPDGVGQIRVVSGGEILFESAPFAFSEGSHDIRMQVPADLPFRTEPCQLAVYLWNEASRNDAFGAVRLPAFPAQGRDWKTAYERWSPAGKGVPLEIGELQIDPSDLVVGEEPGLSLSLANSGGTAIDVRGVALVASEAAGVTRTIERRVGWKTPFPLTLFPGEKRELRWIDLPADEVKSISYEAKVRLRSGPVIRIKAAAVRNPPEVKALSVEPLEKRDAYPLSQPLLLRVRVQNVGGVENGPVRLLASDAKGHQSFSCAVPALAPEAIHEATVEVESPQSAFAWEVRFDLPPKDFTTRTKWKPASFEFEIPRERNLASDMPEGHWSESWDTTEKLAPFITRFFDAGDISLRPSPKARFQDYPVMNLDIAGTPGPDEVRSATHAGVAAWRYQKGWWLSPFQLQAHPTEAVEPLKMVFPWDEGPALMLMAPAYYRHDNYQGLGFPMPGVTLESSAASFDLSPKNTNAEGTFPFQMVDLHRPGLAWTIRHHKRSWPGFSGFRVAYLPEVETPVFVLPGSGPWKPDMQVEWAANPPSEVHYEVRSQLDGSSWPGWSPLTTSPAQSGNRIQLRCWVRPDETAQGMVIRAVSLAFSKASS
jgi:hypothetical protein